LQDPRFATNEARVRHAAELDAAVRAAIGARTVDENRAIIEKNALTAHPVQTIREIEVDSHWRARQLLVDVPNGNLNVRMHNVIPRMSDTPGAIRSAGGDLGADNDDVLTADLGLDAAGIARLRDEGII